MISLHNKFTHTHSLTHAYTLRHLLPILRLVVHGRRALGQLFIAKCANIHDFRAGHAFLHNLDKRA